MAKSEIILCQALKSNGLRSGLAYVPKGATERKIAGRLFRYSGRNLSDGTRVFAPVVTAEIEAAGEKTAAIFADSDKARGVAEAAEHAATAIGASPASIAEVLVRIIEAEGRHP